MAAAPIDLYSFKSLVQNWVQADVNVANLNREALKTRKERDVYETEIFRVLKQANHERAVIQITGGKLVVADERHSQPLSFTSLEEMLHAYYFKVGRADETKEIIKFIKETRTIEHGTKLKRIMSGQ